MVVKIMDVGRTVRSALDYNERKADRGEAELISFFTMDAPPPVGLFQTFDRYEHLNRRTRDVSFHMSINPGEDEVLTRDDAASLAMDIMKGLGYGAQPVVIYEHHDIDRVHYHVISIRTDSNGKKIRDFRERVRCQKLLSDLAPRYGYAVGNGSAVKNADLDIDVSRFDPGRGHVVAQMEAIFRECLTYHFTTFDQFRMIMRGHGLEVTERTGDSTALVLQGLSVAGNPCTSLVDEMATGIEMYKDYEKRASECYSKSNVPAREREKVGRVASYCLYYSRSEDHFVNMMKRKDIDVAFYYHGDRYAGANLVDNQTKYAFKCSELSPLLSVSDFNQAVLSGKWPSGSEDESGHVGHEQESSAVADLADALLQGNGRSHEKDMKERRKRKGHKI